ncbi:MAG: hypothetical protein AB7K09_05380 [Planctomycetota bacterium]
MTRDATSSHPFDLFLPDVVPGQPVNAQVDSLPDDKRLLEVLTNGPLLPFDYCYLRGQREGLVPVVQTQLVMRNPRLVKVDRTPLGIDPNADLFRCFLMHGNPNEPVTVYTFYERDVCAGVVAGYFHVPEIKRHLYMHYSRKGWLDGNALTAAATMWLDAYDAALRWLWNHLLDLDTRERAKMASEWAEWIHPIVRCLDRDDGIRTVDAEQRLVNLNQESALPPGRRAFWELVGDFTFLSIISRPAFCAFAWLKQVQFPAMMRRDAELARSGRSGLYAPLLLWPSIGTLFVGLLIVGFGIGKTFEAGPGVATSLLVGGVPAVLGMAMLLANVIFWVMYTSGSVTLGRVVPALFMRGKPKNVGYLR